MALIKTLGLVLGFIPYAESSIIVRVFTRELGYRSYLVNGVRKNKAKHSIAFFQALSLLEMLVYEKPNANLQRIKEIKIAYPYKEVPFVIKKSSIAIFLTEFLSKFLSKEPPNELLYDFLQKSLIFFDQQQSLYENFHLQLLIHLSDFLGFSIQESTQLENKHQHNEKEILYLVEQLLKVPQTEYVPMSGRQRSVVLEMLICFYAQHHENLKINSLEILRNL